MTAPSVLVLDYGSGNLRSAQRALERAGARVTVSSDPAEGRRMHGMVVPGVGAFAACVDAVRASGAPEVLAGRADQGRPVLGICVGLQILFDSGDEHGEVTEGLGLLPGRVRRLDAPVLPHMGWNTVQPAPDSTLFRGVAGERFYFVHSYAAVAARGRVTTAVHGEPFVAAVEDGAVCGTQFHPEKSGDAGARLLANWVGSL